MVYGRVAMIVEEIVLPEVHVEVVEEDSSAEVTAAVSAARKMVEGFIVWSLG